MQALPFDPRQVLKRAADEAPEPVVRALADVLAASAVPSQERMVVIRFDRDGCPVAEVFTLNRGAEEPATSANLYAAFQTTGEPFVQAVRRGREVRRELLRAEGGVLTGAEVADLLGLSRQAVDKRRRAGRLIGLATGRRGIVYPAWQITETGLLPGLEQVLDDLADHDPWMQVIFLLTPDPRLDGEAPLAELRRGHLDRVRLAAQMLGEHGAA